MIKRATVSGCVIVAALAAAACGSGTPDDGAEISGSVVVFAAASLTDVFGAIGTAFEAEFPGTDVQLNLAGSATLREQILGGASADVFAPADERNMSVVDSAGELASEPVIFAHNVLQIAVPRSNPGQVMGLADLANPDLLVGICVEGVPCGDFARLTLDSAGVEASIDTNEGDVRALLTKIEANELDAGIVYATDIGSTSRVAGIEISADVNVDVRYPIALLEGARSSVTASAFVNFVLSPAGQEIIVAEGFIRA